MADPIVDQVVRVLASIVMAERQDPGPRGRFTSECLMAMQSICSAAAPDLQTDLKLDVLNRIELVMDVEESLNVMIPDEDNGQWITLGDVVDSVKKNKG